MERHLPVSEVFRKDLRPKLKSPYGRRGKYTSGTTCPDCGLHFLDGAWKRGNPPPRRKQHSKRCPACLRIRDDFPAGLLQLGGGFVGPQRTQVLKCVRNAARAALAEHPLERIYRTEERPDEMVLYSTSEHLVAHIGKALRDAFGGELVLHYGPQAEWALARWHRDAD